MLKTQDYLDLVERHRKEIEAFPDCLCIRRQTAETSVGEIGSE